MYRTRTSEQTGGKENNYTRDSFVVTDDNDDDMY